MNRLRRRHFLQLAGASLGAIGLNHLDFMHRGDRIHRALAQPTSRKLALLVGLNNYPVQPLRGCVNDVRLQYELLVHRYGFNPQDILIITDEFSAAGLDVEAREIVTSPTRQTIVERF
ncbi:caspase family protein, partial [Okeania sp. SIO2G5]|uniref:caspase family protein n=1 Tax=Okeania sp. SIO2G5 TaxID=2607796 RepID=UPI0013BF3DDD